MKLILTLTNHDPRTAPSDRTKSVEAGSLRIGRGRDNDWILPDPDRHISKNHCQIDFVGDGYTLTDSSTNGVFVNRTGRPVGRGNAVPLHDGDTIRLGTYDFEVRVESGAGHGEAGFDMAGEPFGGDYAAEDFGGYSGGAEDDPFSAPPPGRGGYAGRDSAGGDDPFGGDFAGMPPRRGGPAHGGGRDDDRFAEPDPFATGQPFGDRAAGGPPDDPFGPPPAEGPGSVGRDDRDRDDPFGIGPGAEPAAYDPFAEDDRPPKRQIDADDPFGGPPPPRGGGGFGEDAWPDDASGRPGGGPTIPDDFDPLADDHGGDAWGGPSEADHVPAEHQSFSVPPSRGPEGAGGAGTIPEDWDMPTPPERAGTPPPPGEASRGPHREPPHGPPQGPPQGPHQGPPQGPPRAPQEGFREAPRQPPPGDRRPTGRPPASGGAAPAGGDPFQAFLAGAGIDPNDLPPEAAAEMMQTVGTLFRDMVAGLCDILMVRANIKERFQMTERTTLRRSENNPLKFSVDADDAMANLITRPRPGFLPADQAVREALGDIKAHELAVLAGMQTALKALLDRFDPANLEKRIEQTSVWDNILPANRKAKYWELFCEHYREIAREAEDDFHGLFGREFTRAYERQVKRL
jgi:type VI secretion system FHA domain protein